MAVLLLSRKVNRTTTH